MSDDQNQPSSEEMSALRDAKPEWVKDGKGVRGDPVIIHNTRAQLVWESKVTYRRPELNSEAS